jgi:hypothetical protein
MMKTSKFEIQGRLGTLGRVDVAAQVQKPIPSSFGEGIFSQGLQLIEQGLSTLWKVITLFKVC